MAMAIRSFRQENRSRSRRSAKKLFAAAVLFVGLEPLVYASTGIWTASFGGQWSDVLNWQASFVPGENDDAEIGGQFVSSISGITNCRGITTFNMTTGDRVFSGSPAMSYFN